MAIVVVLMSGTIDVVVFFVYCLNVHLWFINLHFLP